MVWNIGTRIRTCSNLHGRRDRAILFRCSYNIYKNIYIYIMIYSILPVLLNIKIYIGLLVKIMRTTEQISVISV
nr:MAG TPA: hypothetical protein [Caudoviricetes sp.]